MCQYKKLAPITPYIRRLCYYYYMMVHSGWVVVWCIAKKPKRVFRKPMIRSNGGLASLCLTGTLHCSSALRKAQVKKIQNFSKYNFTCTDFYALKEPTYWIIWRIWVDWNGIVSQRREINCSVDIGLAAHFHCDVCNQWIREKRRMDKVRLQKGRGTL